MTPAEATPYLAIFCGFASGLLLGMLIMAAARSIRGD